MEHTDLELWEKSAQFHGHICPGLTIGYKAALYAKKLLEIERAEDEEVVCVTENDACGVDAISVILGTSVGKGNLIFRLRGKQAFSFFNRKTGKSVRLVLKKSEVSAASKSERQQIMFNTPPEELFEVKDVKYSLPEGARLFESVECESCGESTAENCLRLQQGKKLCLDCYDPYSRFM